MDITLEDLLCPVSNKSREVFRRNLFLCSDPGHCFGWPHRISVRRAKGIQQERKVFGKSIALRFGHVRPVRLPEIALQVSSATFQNTPAIPEPGNEGTVARLWKLPTLH
jgi:hypothetical protein